jgi:hypothetical protein
VYQGDDTLCGAVTCPQAGACCLPDVSCRQETLAGGAQCIADGGEYQGDDTLCGEVTCPQPGACCLPDGSCRQETLSGGGQCIADGGEYQGGDTLCGEVTCPQPGVCGPGGSGDTCADALAAGDGVFAGDMVDNTPDATADCGYNNTFSEWWCYTATCDGTATVTTCLPGTQFDTILSAFDMCGGAELDCNDDTSGAPPECSLGGLNRKSTISFAVTAGESYLVRVSVYVDNFACSVCTGTGYEIAFSCDTGGGGGGEGDCCAPHGTPACEDPACTAAVCADDPFCCDVEWDQICADAAFILCPVLCGGTCAADLTGPTEGEPDGNVDSLDFQRLISQWGSPCAGACDADVTGPTPLVPDGNVDALDFLLIIAQWGSPATCAGP